jgi:hypothetical protein
MREHPKVVGDKTTLAVMAALYEAGYDLYTPFGENTRVDLIVEWSGEILRIQIKSGRLRDGTVRFACCSNYGHHPAPALVRRSYHGEVDAFGVHCRDTERVYLIPIADLSNRNAAWLRVDPPKNNQHDRIRWAADYEIGRVAIEGLRAPSGA